MMWSDAFPDTDLSALPGIVALSLAVSVAATALASAVGLPFAALLALARFPGRRALVVTANALLGLPPVVVGLALYLLFSYSGPLGALGLLFTPTAMVLAQAVLAAPIVTALAHRALEARWAAFGRALQASGASRLRAVVPLLGMSRRPIATAILAGFGRTLSEVGAVIIVGGNIAGQTRTMTTTIALETSKGNLALAMALGMILIGISVAASAAVLVLSEHRNGRQR
jgi:tungstate transport system permease protein